MPNCQSKENLGGLREAELAPKKWDHKKNDHLDEAAELWDAKAMSAQP
jgi:hypothetical protein